ncbi:ImmA/IrrE family metallo-endopeptidase [uncultured Secundilactobacillus sp.]|uniref:ImmA/IrrE family metallo-endopeptidase n=1 Tax=uncultured Secundilactobacillus sp. TaxID=2813935 RepID=UPI0025850D60|nr:ImmA/IrrE family metallo-endopeptidase [uncultured Secundilactobacillus sp.]
MNEYLEAMLNVAFEHGIGYQLIGFLGTHTPSGANPDSKRIAINTSWYRPNQLPFIVAHEIAHILHEDEGILYFHTTYKAKLEGGADRTAVNLLVHEYHRRNDAVPNYVKFMQDFEIPDDLEDCVKDSIMDEYEYDLDYM